MEFVGNESDMRNTIVKGNGCYWREKNFSYLGCEISGKLGK